MKRQSVVAFLLLAVTSAAAISAEPMSPLSSPSKTVEVPKTALPPGPTLEQKLASLTALVAQQQAEIDSFRQQLNDHGNAIEIQISDSDAISDRIATFEQVFSFIAGVMTINADAIMISTDDLSIDAENVDIDSRVRVYGQLRADAIKTDSVDSKSYTPGAGNIW